MRKTKDESALFTIMLMGGSLIRVFQKNIIALKNSKPHFCVIMTLLFGTEKEIEINFTNFFYCYDMKFAFIAFPVHRFPHLR